MVRIDIASIIQSNKSAAEIEEKIEFVRSQNNEMPSTTQTTADGDKKSIFLKRLTQVAELYFHTVLLTLLLSTSTVTHAQEQLIDNFENSSSTAPWIFWSTPNITNASISLTEGYLSSKAIRISYSLECTKAGTDCGEYSMIEYRSASPLNASGAVSFMTRSPATATLKLRVVDESGQTFEYRLPRAPEGLDSSTWYRTFANLNNPVSYWGGARSGRFEGGILKIRILVTNKSGIPTNGNLDIDDVQAHPTSSLENVANDVLIENFETNESTSKWRTWTTPGAEASSAIHSTTGYGSPTALVLDYALYCSKTGSDCGRYAMTYLHLDKIMNATAGIAFMTRSHHTATLKLRVIDESGQTLEYALARPPSGYDEQKWYQAIADFSKPISFWGGTASGHIHGGVKSVQLLVTNKTGATIQGSVEIDELWMLGTMPEPVLTYTEAGNRILENFEDRSVVAPWHSWSTSQEGVAISIQPTAGFSSPRGMMMSYSFNCSKSNSDCGQYGLAILDLDVPVTPTSGLQLMTRSSNTAQLRLRVVDEVGQTLEYRLTRTYSGYSSAAWYATYADFSRPTGYWGGSNSGEIEGGIKSVQIVISTMVGYPVSGVAEFDDIELLTSIPDDEPTPNADGDIKIDDFENRESILPWRFRGDPSTPNGNTMRTGVGFTSARGLNIDYQFNCDVQGSDCGMYNAAILEMNSKVTPDSAIHFMTRSPKSATLKLRVVDASGQQLEYQLLRSSAGYDPDYWYRATAKLNEPTSFWGGSQSGVVEGYIASIQIMVVSTEGIAVSGTVEIDDILLTPVFVMEEQPLSSDGSYSIDTFENRGIPDPWTAVVPTGSEATAMLSSIAGPSSSRALRLNFSFTCTTSGSDCGQYAMATLKLTQEISPLRGLRFNTRSPGESTTRVRIIDSSGQTLEYGVVKPMSAYENGGQWFDASIDLLSPVSAWGGAGTRRIEGKIRSVEILVSSKSGTPISGAVDIDDVRLVTSVPDDFIRLHNGIAELDRFENKDYPYRWFSNTSGRTSSVSLSIGDGHLTAGGLALDYIFRCENGTCGKHVEAALKLPQPVETARYLTMWIRADGNADIAARVTDVNGQTFQYEVDRPLEGMRQELWFPVTLDLEKHQTHWGGPADGIIANMISQISLVAANRFAIETSGQVQADDIKMTPRITREFNLDPMTVNLIDPSSSPTLLRPRLGVAHNALGQTQPLDIAGLMGMSHVRIDLFWALVETEGTYDFALFDAMVDSIIARGMTPVLILDYGHPLYNIHTTSGIEAFARYAATAAQHFNAPNVVFEIWNEPDGPSYWPDNVHGYASLFRAAEAAIRTSNPNALIVSGGLSHFNLSYLNKLLAEDGIEKSDAIALHAYSDSVPEDLTNAWVGARWMMTHHGLDTKPIWITEWGYSDSELTGSPISTEFAPRQANLVLRGVLSQWALGADISTIYGLVNQAEAQSLREQNFGLIDSNYVFKPSADVLTHLAMIASTKSNNGLLDNTPVGLHGLSLEDEHELTFVVWKSTPRTATTIRVNRTNLESVTDCYGNELAGEVDQNLLMIELYEDSGPIYVTYAK